MNNRWLILYLSRKATVFLLKKIDSLSSKYSDTEKKESSIMQTNLLSRDAAFLQYNQWSGSVDKLNSKYEYSIFSAQFLISTEEKNCGRVFQLVAPRLVHKNIVNGRN